MIEITGDGQKAENGWRSWHIIKNELPNWTLFIKSFLKRGFKRIFSWFLHESAAEWTLSRVFYWIRDEREFKCWSNCLIKVGRPKNQFLDFERKLPEVISCPSYL